MSKEREALLKIASEMYYSDKKFSNDDILFVLKNINWKMFKNSLPTETLFAILVEATTK